MPIMQKSTKEDIIIQILNMINEKGKVSLNESDIRKNIGRNWLREVSSQKLYNSKWTKSKNKTSDRFKFAKIEYKKR